MALEQIDQREAARDALRKAVEDKIHETLLTEKDQQQLAALEKSLAPLGVDRK